MAESKGFNGFQNWLPGNVKEPGFPITARYALCQGYTSQWRGDSAHCVAWVYSESLGFQWHQCECLSTPRRCPAPLKVTRRAVSLCLGEY